MPLKVLIKGDSHYGLLSSGVRRDDEVDETYRHFVDLALEVRPDFAVDLGDVFDTPRPTPRQYAMLISNLSVLAAEGIPTLMIPGNHDHQHRPGGWHALEPLAAVPWPGGGVEVVDEVRGWRPPGRPDVEVLCLPYVPEAKLPEGYATQQDYYDRLARAWWAVSAGPSKIAGETRAKPAYRLAVAHLNLGGARKAAGDAVVRDIDVQVPPFLVGKIPVFCGHLHAYQVMHVDPPAVVVGSTQYVDFGEARDRKGFVVLELP